ncbi:MAG: hypothetical protein ABI867_33860 [Kofleriaceae bacterium]
MNEAFAYKFRTSLSIEQIYSRLRWFGPWKWDQRDNDNWDFYMSAVPVENARVRILNDPAEPGWFVVDVWMRSADASLRSRTLAKLGRTLHRWVFRLIRAKSVTTTAAID